MKLLEKEAIILESKNNRLKLTSHRLRYEHKSYMGSTIKSIMLEKLTSCELKHKMDYGLLKKAVLTPVFINGILFLFNQYFMKGELIKTFFWEVSIGSGTLTLIFYGSLFIALIYIVQFFTSIKKVFSFHTVGTSIHIEMMWLDFEERESFISQIEAAIDKRVQTLSIR
jgi:uncharacterized protein YqhQ